MAWQPAEELTDLRVVLVHDWLTGMRGGEKVLESFCRLFPRAPLFTLLHVPGSVSPLIEDRPITASFIQRLPLARSRYRHYLPLFPRAIERLELPECDLVLSSSHCVAKGVRPPKRALHVSYLHTPMRYIWDLYDAYFGPESGGGLATRIMPWLRPSLQEWDVRTCRRCHHFLANSNHVAGRIWRHYQREATVIHPPVEVERFSPAPAGEVEDYYLVVSALVPYKRVDLAVAACTRLRRRLLVVGKGPELGRLQEQAGPEVEFLGWRPDEEVARLMAGARAFLFPGEEDFGITPLESMAAGRPVVAYGRGGALETVVPPDDPADRPPTGLFFAEQGVDYLVAAIRDLETNLDRYVPEALRAHAEGFRRERFEERIADQLARLWEAHRGKLRR